MSTLNTSTAKNESAIQVPSLVDMLKAGVHFGHLTSRWHPKMEPFIFSSRSGVHIINLEATRQQLEKGLKFVSDTIANGGTILLVGTKKQVQDLVKEKAEAVGMPYIHERWIGGLLTNFAVIKKMLGRHAELGKMVAEGDKNIPAGMTKKERLEREREFKRLGSVIGGIASLEKVPDAVFIIDIRREKTALAECRRAGVPIIAICDTNVNPEMVSYPIAGNDDAVRSVALMLDLLTEAVREGMARKLVGLSQIATAEALAASQKLEQAEIVE